MSFPPRQGPIHTATDLAGSATDPSASQSASRDLPSLIKRLPYDACRRLVFASRDPKSRVVLPFAEIEGLDILSAWRLLMQEEDIDFEDDEGLDVAKPSAQGNHEPKLQGVINEALDAMTERFSSIAGIPESHLIHFQPESGSPPYQFYLLQPYAPLHELGRIRLDALACVKELEALRTAPDVGKKDEIRTSAKANASSSKAISSLVTSGAGGQKRKQTLDGSGPSSKRSKSTSSTSFGACSPDLAAWATFQPHPGGSAAKPRVTAVGELKWIARFFRPLEQDPALQTEDVAYEPGWDTLKRYRAELLDTRAREVICQALYTLEVSWETHRNRLGMAILTDSISRMCRIADDTIAIECSEEVHSKWGEYAESEHLDPDEAVKLSKLLGFDRLFADGPAIRMFTKGEQGLINDPEAFNIFVHFFLLAAYLAGSGRDLPDPIPQQLGRADTDLKVAGNPAGVAAARVHHHQSEKKSGQTRRRIRSLVSKYPSLGRPEIPAGTAITESESDFTGDDDVSHPDSDVVETDSRLPRLTGSSELSDPPELPQDSDVIVMNSRLPRLTGSSELSDPPELPPANLVSHELNTTAPVHIDDSDDDSMIELGRAVHDIAQKETAVGGQDLVVDPPSLSSRSRRSLDLSVEIQPHALLQLTGVGGGPASCQNSDDFDAHAEHSDFMTDDEHLRPEIIAKILDNRLKIKLLSIDMMSDVLSGISPSLEVSQDRLDGDSSTVFEHIKTPPASEIFQSSNVATGKRAEDEES